MSDEDEEYDMPTGRVAQLQYSISNLIEDFGQTDSIGLGLVINLVMVGLGIVVWAAFSGLVAFVGAVFAIVHILAIVKWVLGL